MKLNKLVIFWGFTALFWAGNVAAQPQFDWMRDISGPDNDLSGGVVVDPLSGSFYIAGAIDRTPDIYTPWIGPGVGKYAGFLARHDTLTGDPVWAVRFNPYPSGSDVLCGGTCTDPLGNIYVTGAFKDDSLTFESISGNSNTTLYGNANLDIFLVKYDPNGEVLWALKNSQGSGDDQGLAVVADGSGVYLGGSFRNSGADFDPSPSGGATINTAFGDETGFIAKYDLQGNGLIWKIEIGSGHPCMVTDIAADNGRLYFVGNGTFNDPVQFWDHSNTNYANLIGFGNWDIFFGSINKTNGTFSGATNFVNEIGMNGENKAYGLALDATQVYLSGHLEAGTQFPGGTTVDYPGNDKRLFVSAHDKSTGVENWVEVPRCPGGGHSYGRNIEVGPIGRVVVTAYSKEALSFQGNPVIESNSGSEDLVLMNFEPYGKLNWARYAGGTSHEAPVDMALDPVSGTAYIIGRYDGTPSFDGLPALPNLGGEDIFFGKIRGEAVTPPTAMPPPDWGWVAGVGPANDQVFEDVSTEVTTGNTYAIGYFEGDLTAYYPTGFNGTPDMNVGPGIQAGMVVKYDSSGAAIWAFKIAGPDNFNVHANAITLGPAGNIYITGSFRDEIDFDGVTGSPPHSLVSDERDVFIACYNSSGNCQWARRGTGEGNNHGLAIATSVDGVYITGVYNDDIDFGGLDLDVEADEEAFIVKYDFAGNPQWAQRVTGTNGNNPDERGLGIASDGDNVFVVGQSFSHSWNFDGVPTINNHQNNTSEIWIACFRESNGNFVWEQKIGGTANDEAHGIAVDGTSVYITGGVDDDGTRVIFPGDVQIPTGNTKKDIFLCKLDKSDGALDWVIIEHNNSNTDAMGQDVICDDNGNVLLIGFMTGLTPYNNGANPIGPVQGSEVFLMARKNDGDFLWVESGGGTGMDKGLGIAYDQGGRVYVGGSYRNNAIIGGNNLPGNGGENCFVARLQMPGPCAAQFNFPDSAYCQTEDDTVPNILYQPGGIFSENSGNVVFVSTSTGEIDFSESTPGGPYFINYTAPGGCSESFPLRIDSNMLAIVGPDQMVCPEDSVVLFGNAPMVGPGIWSTVVGPGLVTGQNSPVSGVTNLQLGINAFQWELSNGECAATVDTVVITVQGEAPTISCPATQSQHADPNCQLFLDNYIELATLGDPCGIFDLVQVPDSGTMVAGAVVSVTLYVIGGANDTNSCVFNVDLVDTIPPSIACPGNQIEFVDTACQGILGNYIGLATAGDNCSDVTVFQAPLAGAVAGLGTTTIIALSASDISGNTNSCTFNVEVEDSTPPVITCPQDTIEEPDSLCQFTLPDYRAFGFKSDNCTSPGSITVTQSPGIGSVLGGTTAISFVGTDSSGNSHSCMFTVILYDTTAPSIICPGNKTVAADSSCGYLLGGYASQDSVEDNCGNATVTQIPIAGDTIGLGTTPVLLIAEDGNGNRDSCTFEVVINDSTGPSITCPDSARGYANSNCEYVLPNYADSVLAFDHCSTAMISQDPGLPFAAGLGKTTIILTASDDFANTTTCTFEVEVLDTTPPVITCPQDTTRFMDSLCNFVLPDFKEQLTGFDNCFPFNSLAFSQSPSVSVPISGDSTITITVTDSSGNSVSCSFTIYLGDSTAPEINCPTAYAEITDSNCQITIPQFFDPPFANDGCNMVTYSQSISPQTNLPGVPVWITLYAEDDYLNIDSCSFQIDVQDNLAPEITCPGVQTIPVNAICEYKLHDFTDSATVFDNCSPDDSLTVAQTPDLLTVVSGDTLIVLTVEDLAGNTATCSFIVIPEDTTMVNLSCPGDTTVLADPELNCSAIVDVALPSASDNCAGWQLINDYTGTAEADGQYFVGTTTLTWELIDNAGNSDTCSMNITVTDSSPPQIACPPDIIVDAAEGACSALVSYELPAVQDNCSNNVSQIMGFPSESLFPIGITLNTFVTFENAENTDSCTFSVTVNNTSLSTFLCPADIVTCDTNVVVTQPYFSDICGFDRVENDWNGTSNASDEYPAGTHNVIWTVFDTLGNSASCPMSIAVFDHPTPVEAFGNPDVYFLGETELSATLPLVGTGHWTSTFLGMIERPDEPVTKVSGLDEGGNIFKWKVTNGPCSDSVMVEVYHHHFIPERAFSPNGDGVNDVFVIPGILDFPNSKLNIFSRWGTQVYQSEFYLNGWDGISKHGVPVPDDTYYYVLEVADGPTVKGVVVVKR